MISVPSAGGIAVMIGIAVMAVTIFVSFAVTVSVVIIVVAIMFVVAMAAVLSDGNGARQRQGQHRGCAGPKPDFQ